MRITNARRCSYPSSPTLLIHRKQCSGRCVAVFCVGNPFPLCQVVCASLCGVVWDAMSCVFDKVPRAVDRGSLVMDLPPPLCSLRSPNSPTPCLHLAPKRALSWPPLPLSICLDAPELSTRRFCGDTYDFCHVPFAFALATGTCFTYAKCVGDGKSEEYAPRLILCGTRLPREILERGEVECMSFFS